MYCPKCSQKQISDEIRYCSKCGFNLTDVAEALKNNGLIERNLAENTKDLKKVVTKGLIALILSGIFFTLSLIFGTPEPSLFVQFNLLVGVLGFIFGLTWIAYFFWFKQETTQINSEKSQNLKESRSAQLLNEPNVESYIPPQTNLQTNDLVEVSTITEGTTKLLQKNDKEQAES